MQAFARRRHLSTARASWLAHRRWLRELAATEVAFAEIAQRPEMLEMQEVDLLLYLTPQLRMQRDGAELSLKVGDEEML